MSLSNPSDQAITVDYASNDGTATVADGDYAVTSGTVTFLAGQTTKTIDVTVNGDVTYEGDENFTVDLSNETNATIGDGSGQATIANDDSLPSISVDDVSADRKSVV